MARLAPHLGTRALRAASEPEAHPHARRLHRYGPGVWCGVAAATILTNSRDACFALGSVSAFDFSKVRRVRRLGLGLRSPPADLAIDPAFGR